MVPLKEYVNKCITEEVDKSAAGEADKELKAAIKWDIWEEPSVKTNWLKDNYSYNKIQFVYTDTSKGIEICFLMGYTENDSTDNLPESWKMWAGKTGAVSYADDWSWDLKTDDFNSAIIKSLDIIVNFIRTVESDRHNYVAYYVHL